MTTLESRYRRLLAWYPSEHRQRFGEEMLGVLMDGAEPEQRSPRLGESFDLMRNAVWKRIGRTRESTEDGSPWAKAGAVVGLLASMLLFAGHTQPVSSYLVFTYWSGPNDIWLYDPSEAWIRFVYWALAGIWLVATLTVLSRWRGIAIGTVWLGVLAELYVAYVKAPSIHDMIYQYEYIVLGLTAAIGLTMAGTAHYGVRLLGFRWTAMAIGVSLLVTASAVVGVFFDTRSAMEVDPIWLVMSMLIACTVVIVVMVWRLGGPIRRRAFAMAMPAFVVHLFVSHYSATHFSITAIELVVISFVVLVLSLLMVRLLERLQIVRKAPPSTGMDSPVK